MIDGFEDYTKDLTVNQKADAMMLIASLRASKGKKRAVTNQELRQIFYNKTGKWLPEPVVRKMIGYIRLMYISNLCAYSGGYYIARNKAELAEYIESLSQRIRQQQTILANAKDYHGKMV